MQKVGGQWGTLGTQAIIRVPAFLQTGDMLGTSGDDDKDKAPSVDALVGVHVTCSQLSPIGPHTSETRKPSTRKVSPLFPLVPLECGMVASGVVLEREAFEERAAIMEFDGMLSHEEAERLAAESLGSGLTREELKS